jgi:DNA (cytosine-5)-methyltransferase 1
MVAFGEYVSDETASAMKMRDYKDATDLVTHSLRGEGFDASEDGQVAVAFHNNLARYGGNVETERTGPLKAVGMKDPTLMMRGMQVRRLTPRECERLQGFPDDYTLIPHRNKQSADGPRYKALGNSMAVPVMRWIGERIAEVDEILQTPEAKA